MNYSPLLYEEITKQILGKNFRQTNRVYISYKGVESIGEVYDEY